MGYIYLRKNKVNGKCYVGQTKDIKTRNRQWKNLNWEYGGVIIERARAKYGTDGFSFEILRECPNEEMDYWEKYYVKEYNSKKPYGYNSTDGGDSTYERTDEIRKKMSEAHKGKKQSPEFIEKRIAKLRGRKRPAEVVAKCADANKGKKRSPESIEKRAAKLRGKKHSEEHKAKIAAASRGRKNHFYGKRHTDETKAKISAALKTSEKAKIARAKTADAMRGKPKPKISAALRGRKRPDISAALKGRKLSDETKAKMSAARRGRKRAAEVVAKVVAAKSKAVQALDKDGNIVYEFPSMAEAGRQGFKQSAVSNCCLGKVKTHKGLIWRYKENAQE